MAHKTADSQEWHNNIIRNELICYVYYANVRNITDKY